jgi:hypothetical protein
MWDEEHQGWHDIIANTAVVKVKHWRFNDIVSVKPPIHAAEEKPTEQDLSG